MRVRTRQELLGEWVRRLLTYTDKLSWFGANSVSRAMGWTTAILVESADHLYVAMVRRFTLLNARGADLVAVAAERGVTQLPASRARLFVVVDPKTANVAGVRTVGADAYIEVDDSFFQAGDSIRIRSEDGSTTETATVASISSGTGPVNSDDELVITGGLTESYSPASEDVDVLIRVTIAEGTEVSATSGVTFHTLASVVTGEANAVLDGEGTALSLADKVWCECTTLGASGNIEQDSILNFTAGAVRGIARVWNPERGSGGDEVESDIALKYRATHGPAVTGQETLAWLESMATAVNSNVIRATQGSDHILGTMVAALVNRNGGAFSTTELADISAALSQRTRSYMAVTCSSIVLTSVEVEAKITLKDGYTLEQVWRDAASRLANFIDYRLWDFGTDVDEADLLTIVNATPGVASLETASFLPASDVAVAAGSLPTLTRLSLQDTATGYTRNASLAQSF